MLDERTERLIHRKLDACLSAEEELELNKRLIRDPLAREELARLERIEALAAQTVAQVTGGDAFPPDRHDFEQVEVVARRRSFFRPWLSGVAGMAASFLLMVLVSGWPASPAARELPLPLVGASAGGEPETAQSRAAEVASMVNYQGPRREDHHTQRRVVGVYDPETDSYYLLEMDETHRTVAPLRQNY